ncbi:chaplin [Streptomyces naphthomycinicus]|uniref:chaplin n=1 Tax=Streptomyces naphthomycinicus TaxID=2872625 RepID=UPI001CEE002D|nr:chaplin [Streptomyces sp. TML10]
MIAVTAASGAMAVALPVSAAFAADGADAHGTAVGSPGVVSGNNVQVPVHAPVNVCGNTANVVGLLNPAAGNSCANRGGAKGGGAGKGGSAASGRTSDSPGVLSGNDVQLPVDLPLNVSGNSVNVVGVGNPAVGNESVNGPGEDTTATPKPRAPRVPASRSHSRPGTALAETGADVKAPAAIGGAALVAMGAILYRRCRPGRTR